MRYFKKIVGERIYLSPANPDDAEQYTAWLNDPAVSTMLGQHNSVLSLPAERKLLEQFTSGGYNFAIVRAEDDTLLGNCSFFAVDQQKQRAECGIFIGDAENRGKGYGTEALRLLLDYGFNTLNLHSVMLTLNALNEQGRACYEKVGFQLIGRRREACYTNGQRHDSLYMDILKHEFYAKK